MKKSIFLKSVFCLLAIVICSLVSVSAETVTAFDPPGWSEIVEMSTPVLAVGALAIPAYELENLKCVTQTVFKDLQSKLGKLYVIDVNIDTDESYQFLLRRPTRQHLEIIES